jgi:hypothetical protein
MSFYQEFGYLPPDMPPADLIRILMLTHVFLLRYPPKAFQIGEHTFRTDEAIENLEYEITRLLKAKIDKNIITTEITTVDLIDQYPVVKNLLQQDPDAFFDITVAINSFDSEIIPWWWIIDPLKALLEELVIERVADSQKWIEASKLFFEKKNHTEAILALEDALWEARDEGPEIERLLGNVISQAAPNLTAATPHAYVADKLESLRALPWQEHPIVLRDIYRYLQGQKSISLRKKTRWLLWRKVLRETQDPIEFERQREELLSSLALRGVENFEVPPYVKSILMESTRRKTLESTGQGLEFLRRAQALISSFAEPPTKVAEAVNTKSILLTIIGQAFATLGSSEEATSLAASINDENVVVNFRKAILEDGSSSAFDAPIAQLAALARAATEAVGSREAMGKRSSTKKQFADCFKALEPVDISLDDVVNNMIEAAQEAAPEICMEILDYSIDSLIKLGAADVVINLFLENLEPGALEEIRAKEAAKVTQYGTPQRDLLVQKMLIGVVKASEATTTKHNNLISSRFFDIVNESPWLIDEFIIDTLALIFKYHDDPWQGYKALAGNLEDYEKVLVRIAALSALVKRGNTTEIECQLLLETLEQAQELTENRPGTPADMQVMRTTVNITKIVPNFGLMVWGHDVIQQISNIAQDRESYFTNEIKLATNEAASKLADTQSTFDLIESNMHQTLAHLTASAEAGKGRSQSGVRPEIVFESLDKIVDTVATIGNAERGRPLIEAIQAAAHERLKQNENEGKYFCVTSLIKCSYGLAVLGDDQRPNFIDIFSLIPNFGTHDYIDLLRTIVECIRKLPGEMRYWLADRMLDIYIDKTDCRTVLRDLIEVMVAGEDAYIKALQHWKNQEERSIRDRAVNETL